MSVLECTFVYNYACKYDLVCVCRLSTLHCVCVCMCVSVSMVDFSPLTSMSGNLINCYEAYTAPPLCLPAPLYHHVDIHLYPFWHISCHFLTVKCQILSTLSNSNKDTDENQQRCYFWRIPFPIESCLVECHLSHHLSHLCISYYLIKMCFSLCEWY